MMSTLRVRRRTKRLPKQQNKNHFVKISHITTNHHESKGKNSQNHTFTKQTTPTFSPFPPKVFCITPNYISSMLQELYIVFYYLTNIFPLSQKKDLWQLP